MKDLEKMFDEALLIVADCIGKDKIEFIYRPITINTRAKKRWGMCRKSEDGRNRIEISKRILNDKVDNNAVMCVIIHEILHACKDGDAHTGAWKQYAAMVNQKYPQYKISRLTPASRFGLEKEQTEKMKYAIKCTKCGNMHYSSRLSNTIKNPSGYRCAICGGKFKRIR